MIKKQLKVKREQFRKLKQLDRIEYILKDNLIREDYRYICLEFVGAIFIIWGYLFVLGLLFFIAFEQALILNIFLSSLLLFKIGLIMALAHDVVIYFRRKKTFERLDKEFLK